MRITLNKIEFEIETVSVQERAAILADPSIAPAIWREVYRWDHTAQKGEIVTQGVTPKGQIILPNGILFYVSKSGGTEKAAGPTDAMGKRVLEALGAKAPVDIMRAIAQIVQIPKMVLPRKSYVAIEPAVSYSLRMYTEFSVLRLRNASRNLSFVIALPGQCIYHHEITAKDDAAYDALVAEKPEVANIQPRFILAPTSDANRNIRVLALIRWLKDMQEQIKAVTGDGEAVEDQTLKSAYGRAVAEYQVLTKKAKVQPGPVVAKA